MVNLRRKLLQWKPRQQQNPDDDHDQVQQLKMTESVKTRLHSQLYTMIKFFVTGYSQQLSFGCLESLSDLAGQSGDFDVLAMTTVTLRFKKREEAQRKKERMFGEAISRQWTVNIVRSPPPAANTANTRDKEGTRKKSTGAK